MNITEFFQKPQVQAILVRACGASGLIGAVIVKACHWVGLPVPDVGTETMVITWMGTEAVEWVVAWYRNNPNNILRRLAKHINGNGITEETKAEVTKATSTIPGVQVHVDTSVNSPAPEAVQKVAQDGASPDVVVMGPAGPVVTP